QHCAIGNYQESAIRAANARVGDGRAASPDERTRRQYADIGGRDVGADSSRLVYRDWRANAGGQHGHSYLSNRTVERGEVNKVSIGTHVQTGEGGSRTGPRARHRKLAEKVSARVEFDNAASIAHEHVPLFVQGDGLDIGRG